MASGRGPTLCKHAKMLIKLINPLIRAFCFNTNKTLKSVNPVPGVNANTNMELQLAWCMRSNLIQFDGEEAGGKTAFDLFIRANQTS